MRTLFRAAYNSQSKGERMTVHDDAEAARRQVYDDRIAAIEAQSALLASELESKNAQVVNLSAQLNAAQGTIENQIGTIATLRSNLQASEAAFDALEQTFAEHMLTEHEPVPPETPKFLDKFLYGQGGGGVPIAPWETLAGVKMGLHRDFFDLDTAGHADKAVAVATDDINNGRIPVLSFKCNDHTWDQVSAGATDVQWKSLFARLGALPGYVMVTFNHEPEKDEADMQDFVRATQRVAPLTLPYPSLKYGLIFMGYHQEPGRDPALSFDALWPGDNVGIAWLGLDRYQMYGAEHGAQTSWTNMQTAMAAYSAFAKKKNIPWGLTEHGVSDMAMVDNPTRAKEDFDKLDVWMKGYDYPGKFIIYFNTNVSSTAAWAVTRGTPKEQWYLAAIRRGMAA